MQRYLNLSGNSGVEAYEIESMRIRVRFKEGGVYSYSYGKAGRAHVDRMKLHAIAGRGLNTYIKQHVNYLYD